MYTPTQQLNESMRSPPSKWGGMVGSSLAASLPLHAPSSQVFCLAPNTGVGFPPLRNRLRPWARVAQAQGKAKLRSCYTCPVCSCREIVHIVTRGGPRHLPELTLAPRPHTVLPGPLIPSAGPPERHALSVGAFLTALRRLDRQRLLLYCEPGDGSDGSSVSLSPKPTFVVLLREKPFLIPVGVKRDTNHF